MSMGMIVGVTLEVYVFVGMCGFGLDLYRGLDGIGGLFEGLRQGLPRFRRRIGDLVPPQIPSQRLELRECIRLVLHATQRLAQGHFQQ
ncbi:MAG: hypothetical protein JW854_12385 [Actinobacteria bacterium]|nr:hypothetical protein [Actinomycetota bacterium]